MMAGQLSARRCARLSHALVLFFAALLVAGGQRNALVLGEDVAAAGAAAAAASPGSSEGADETVGKCVDHTPMLEELVLAKTNLQRDFDDCEDKRIHLERLMKALEGTVESQSKIIDEAGGSKGIQELIDTASAAGDNTTLLEAAKEEAENARKDAAAAREEAEAAKKEAGEAEQSIQAAREETAAAQETSARLASEKEAVRSELDAASHELETLRKDLSKAEAKESKARQELEKKADDIRGKLERTTSELEIAKKPRVVSVSAIMKDVRQLGNDLAEQTKDARDDIVQRATEKAEKVRAVVEPRLVAAAEASKPVLKTAMDKTEPHRAKAREVFGEYRVVFDEKVGAPVTEKWLIAKEHVSKAWQEAMATTDEVGEAVVAKLVSVGASEDEARKACHYVNLTVLGLFAVLFLVYFLRTIVVNIVWPVVHTVLRLALWVVKVPVRIVYLPVRLVLWALTKCFRLAFGGGGSKGKGAKSGKGNSQGAASRRASAAQTGSRNSKKNK
ncbi:unnamed protein product [Scytosiphon promiscuus]